MRTYIGLDPGVSGGIAVVADDNLPPQTLKLKDATEADVFEWLRSHDLDDAYAVLEKVGATPQMGTVSAFTFGRGYGLLRGILTGARIPFADVTPQRWQKEMGCLSKGDKNKTKQRAQQLYPTEKITHATADAILLATFCRRCREQLF